jgi:hypothetical protein
MSSSRLSYDDCSYKTELTQSVSPLNYMLDPIKYEHCNKCRMEMGILGGTAVSHIAGNLVDLENDLRNQTRPNTHCPIYKYLPMEHQGKEYIKPVSHPEFDTTMKHLKSCQMFNYNPVPPTPPINVSSCSMKR